ncbi:MAG: cation:proton antiporter [Methanobacterium sp.]|jgi:NhaP-type Na+/H+ or K+/H+ antiporter
MNEILIFFVTTFIFALFSKRLAGSIITAHMVFIAAGLLIGWLITSYIDIRNPPISDIVLLIAEIALVLVLFSDASRIGPGSLRGNNLPTRLLGIGLTLTIILGIIIAALLFTDLTIWEAGIIGVVLAPTDAALGQIVVKNKKLPDGIRKTLEIESGLNDGLSVPFLLVFIAIGLAEETFRPIGLFIEVALEQIGLGVLIGLSVGIIGGLLIIKARNRDWITPTYQRIGFLAMALISFIIADEIGGSGFIAAFIGGLATGYVIKDAGEILTDFTAEEGQLLNLAVFFLLGVILASLIGSVTWQIVLYAILSLTVIRMIPVAVSLIGTKLNKNSILFIGWFGPRGLASIVLVLIAIERLHSFPGLNTVLLTVLITVLFSIFAHGITASPLSNLYARKIKEQLNNE